jgi:hypothetical protein
MFLLCIDDAFRGNPLAPKGKGRPKMHITREKLTASVSDLDTSLTNVHGDNFTHFEREIKAGESTTSKLASSL